MPDESLCPNCGQRYQVERSLPRHKIRCDQCGWPYLSQSERKRPPEAEEPEEGLSQRIGRFEIRRKLGAGAFGTVYYADDPVLDRPVALKVLRGKVAASARARSRFLLEGKAAAQLRHPNIVPVYDAGADGDQSFIAYAHIKGETLEDEIDHDVPDPRRSAENCRRLADALHYAHSLDIVHRDVKSSNVMVDTNGEVHLMDFGLARVIGSDERLTHDGTLLGTPAYMAPEQASAELGEVGPCSDQYSLGVVLYESLCGELPFSGLPAIVVFNVINTEPPAPSTIAADVPQDLEAICLKAMAKRPEERYGDCGELAEDLRRWLAGEPTQARPVGPVERLRRWTKRNPLIAGLAVVAVTLMVIVATVASRALLQVQEEKRELARLVEVKGKLAVDKAKTDQDIKTSEEVRRKREEENQRIAGDNAQKQNEIDNLQQEMQRKVRQKLREFLEKAPDELVKFLNEAPVGRIFQATHDVDADELGEAVSAPDLNESVSGEALIGEPFGVGLLSVRFTPDGLNWRPDEPMRASSRGDIVFYPVYTPHWLENEASRKLRSLDVHFLFRGSEPLELTLDVGSKCVIRATVPVTSQAQRHTDRMDEWWARYKKPSVGQSALRSSKPSAARIYLVQMLANRLGRKLTEDDAARLLGPCDRYLGAYRDLLRSETSNDAIIRLGEFFPWEEAVRRHWQLEAWNAQSELYERGSMPNEELTSWKPKAAPNVLISDLASHVPQECYYARFGSVEDALWLLSRLGELGGSLRSIDTASALDADIGRRLLRQLALHGIVGGMGSSEGLISDIAVVGTDAYFQDGAAVGIIVKTDYSKLLGELIRLQRELSLRAGPPGIRSDDFEVDGHEYSLLETDDKSVRSFYASDGDFHLISNSKYIVQRFFQAGRGKGSLAMDPQFLKSRERFWKDQQPALMLYVPDAFWKRLLGRPYVLETLRRYRARADLELVDLARLTAAAEGTSYDGLTDLVAQGLLPPRILTRFDDGLPQLDSGILSDSLRGLPGTFLPIPDVILEGGVDPRVSKWEQGLCEAYAQNDSFAVKALGHLGPLLVTGSRRSTDGSGGETIVLDVHFAFPLREMLAGLSKFRNVARILGPKRTLGDLLRDPSDKRVAPLPGDVAFVEIALRTEACRTFGGFRDWEIPHRIHAGQVEVEEAKKRNISLYVGETATKGLLGTLTQFGYGPQVESDITKYATKSRDPLRYRLRYPRYGKSWVALASRRETLGMLAQDQVAESGYPQAQIRVHLGNISDSKLADTLRSLAYVRARRMSAANALLLEEYLQQLHLLPDAANAAANEHYRGNLICPLGGDYTWKSHMPNSGWTGTAWAEQSLYDETRVPEDYRLPLIDKLRGAEIGFGLADDGDGIDAHIEIHLRAE